MTMCMMDIDQAEEMGGLAAAELVSDESVMSLVPKNPFIIGTDLAEAWTAGFQEVYDWVDWV